MTFYNLCERSKNMSLLDIRIQNRQTVIEIALKCFIEDGIEQSKISYIAKRAGLTERSIYRYFENKAELVFEAALCFWNENTSKIEQECVGRMPQISGLESIREVLLAYGEIYFISRQKLIFIHEAEFYLNKCGKSGLLENKPPVLFEKSNGPLAEAIRRGLADGTVNPKANIELLYFNAFDALLGLMQKLALSYDDDSMGEKLSARNRIRSLCTALTNSFSVGE